MKILSQKISKRRNYSDKELAELFAIDELNIKYTPPKFTDKELLEIFPEAKDIIPLKIKECKLAIREKEREIQSTLKGIYSLRADSFSEFFAEEVIKIFVMPELALLEKNLFRLKRFEYLSKPTSKINKRFEFEEKIEIARRFPIEELARSKLELRQVGRNFISLCPLHNEKTPSFYVYPETNSFYCFGCNQGNDVINLAMALYGLTFKEAVEMLQN